jgi:hypothetical protein
MRFLALTLGALDLAGLTIGEAVNNEASPSAAYSATVKSQLARWHPTNTAPRGPWLTRTHPPEVTPTRSMHTAALRCRQDISYTVPFTEACKDGYTTSKEIFQTDVCTISAKKQWKERPCALSRVAKFVCKTISTTYTKWSTNDLGSRSQRWVARFAQPTITPTPTEIAATSVTWPICSFDVTKGEYICLETAKTLPLCSFDVSDGKYSCPTVAAPTPTPTEEKLYHVNAHDDKVPPPDRCVECAFAIDDCSDDCNEDNQECYNACPCEMHQQIPACQRCKGYMHACDGPA